MIADRELNLLQVADFAADKPLLQVIHRVIATFYAVPLGTSPAQDQDR